MKILIIQTAFLGDVVLATGLLEKLRQHHPEAQLDILVRKGNESLLKGHPFLHEVLVWNKKEKYKDLLRLLKLIRSWRYDYVINLQRFGAMGLLTALSGAKVKVGFEKNPFSRFFSKTYPHPIGKKGDATYLHEIERNHQLIRDLTDDTPAKPRLYPTPVDRERIENLTGLKDLLGFGALRKYITISPGSVWFTKRFPAEKWIEFLNEVPPEVTVYLLGSPGEAALCEEIKKGTTHARVEILAGKLSLLQSAALMEGAVMNYSNDSAPLHLASAMNAPIAAVFCSTIPEFGFGPLSDKSYLIEIEAPLPCRPCGLHGRKECPLGHFRCAKEIRAGQLLRPLLQELLSSQPAP